MSGGSQWKPIDTCPLHTDVLFWREDQGISFGQYTHCAEWVSEEEQAEHGYDEETLFKDDVFVFDHTGAYRCENDEQPTHWMPLPPPPAAIQLSSPVTVLTSSAPFETFRDASFSPEMVMVPAGKFMMGSPVDELGRCDDEGPQHEVTIAKPFAIGVYPVTRGEFAAFVSATNYDAGDRWRDPGFAQDDSHPVVCVSWDDAQAYTKWLCQKTGKTYRLPSEAEWEYVCRAGTTTPFWWGSAITPEQANYDGNYSYAGGGSEGEYRQKTVPADSFQANPWGLYQVHGNAWEWCEDCWNENYSGAATDGSAWTTGDGCLRVLRGGSWFNYPRFLRSAYRFRYASDYRSSNYGFRLART